MANIYIARHALAGFIAAYNIRSHDVYKADGMSDTRFVSKFILPTALVAASTTPTPILYFVANTFPAFTILFMQPVMGTVFTLGFTDFFIHFRL